MIRKTDLTTFLQLPDQTPQDLPQLPLQLPPGVRSARTREGAPPVQAGQVLEAMMAAARPVEPQAPAQDEPPGQGQTGKIADSSDALSQGAGIKPRRRSRTGANSSIQPGATLALVKPSQKSTPDRSPDRIAELEERRQARWRGLAQEAVEIAERDAWDAQRVGFISSTMVQLTLPHREPDPSLPVWGRQQDGGKSLIVQPGFFLSDEMDAKGNRLPVCLGYPFGSIPRLILAWVGREVVRTRSRELNPSESLAGFMRELGITSTNGGERGAITRVRDQVRRLFSARIALVDKPSETNWSNHGFQIADSIETWWSSGADASQRALFQSRIVLSQVFHDEILRSPVPLDMRALATLKQSPMALDVYCFLTYRYFLMSNSRSPVSIRWELLFRQFGSESEISRFRQLFRQALQKVLAVYPQARFDADGPSHLTLFPSPTHVRPRQVAFGGRGPASAA